MFDLEYDPAPFLDINLEEAKRLLKANPRPIRILGASNFPIVRSWQPDADLGVDLDTARARLEQIRRHPTFATVVGEALAGQYDDEEPSEHIEEQIFGGFPGKKDSALMEKFHREPWERRYGICQSFEDAKYRKFGERLLFTEYPAALPQEVREALDRWCQERHQTADECKWMTWTKALEELRGLEENATPAHEDLISEIRAFFQR